MKKCIGWKIYIGISVLLAWSMVNKCSEQYKKLSNEPIIADITDKISYKNIDFSKYLATDKKYGKAYDDLINTNYTMKKNVKLHKIDVLNFLGLQLLLAACYFINQVDAKKLNENSFSNKYINIESKLTTIHSNDSKTLEAINNATHFVLHNCVGKSKESSLEILNAHYKPLKNAVEKLSGSRILNKKRWLLPDEITEKSVVKFFK